MRDLGPVSVGRSQTVESGALLKTESQQIYDFLSCIFLPCRDSNQGVPKKPVDSSKVTNNIALSPAQGKEKSPSSIATPTYKDTGKMGYKRSTEGALPTFSPAVQGSGRMGWDTQPECGIPEIQGENSVLGFPSSTPGWLPVFTWQDQPQLRKRSRSSCNLSRS